MNYLDLIIYLLYFVFVIFLIILAKSAKSMNEFALGNRQFGSIIIFASLASTAIGPGFTTGLFQKIVDNGLVWLGIFAFFSIQMIITGIIFAPKLRSLKNVMTLGDVIGLKYGRLAKIISGVISVLFSIGIVGAIAKATGNLLNVVLGIDPTIGIVISTLIVIIYSTIGGLKTDTLTDVLQFIVLSIGIPILLFFLLFNTPTYTIPEVVLYTPPTNIGIISLISLSCSFLLGEFLLPPYASRALSARTVNAARNSFILAGIFSMIWFIVISIISLFSINLFPNTPSENLFFLTIVKILPPGMRGLILAAITAIIASSQDSFLNSASVIFSRDIIKSKTNRFVNNQLSITKGLCFIFGLGGMILALLVPSIIDALLIAYTLWAPIMVVPLIIALLTKSPKPISGLASMIIGGTTVLIWTWILNEPYGVTALLPGVICSAISFIIFEYLFPSNFTWRFLKPILPEEIN